MSVAECVEQGDQRADQGRVEAADFVVGLDAVTGDTACPRHNRAAYGADQIASCFAPVRGQAKTGALFGIEAPADAGAFDPAMQRRQVALLDGEAFAQGRDVEQVEDFTDREAAVGELEQVFDGDQQRVAAALALVGEGEGDEARIIAVQLAEHRANVRRVTVDVGDHDDDVAGTQRRDRR